MNNVSEISNFNNIIGAKEAAESFIEMTVHQIDSACMRDMYMNTLEAMLSPEEKDELFNDAAMEAASIDTDDIDLDIDFEASLNDVDEFGKNGSCAQCGKSLEACDCGNDPSCKKTIDSLPSTDPSDAATFFNITGKKTSAGDVESPKAVSLIKEQLDYVNAVVPDTFIAYSASTTESANEPAFGPEISDLDNMMF